MATRKFTNQGPVVYTNVGSVVRAQTITGNVRVSNYQYNDSSYFYAVGPDLNFTGRYAELRDLKRILMDTNHSTQIKYVAVVGLGSIGKSQLVKQFIKENRNSYYHNIWIDASSSEELDKSFKTIAQDVLHISIVNVDGREKNVNVIIAEVFKKMSDRKALIVYDNVENIETIRQGLMVASSGEIHFIITSRYTIWNQNIKCIKLKAWDVFEAIEYVTKALDEPADTEDDKKLLVERLDALPLRLTQAISHIQYRRSNGSYNILDYLEICNTVDMLNCRRFLDFGSSYDKTLFTTWDCTIDNIKLQNENGQLAVKILEIIAFFDSTNIQEDIFANIMHTDYDTHILPAISLLANYSMIERDREKRVLSIHKSVQQVTKVNLQELHQVEPILRDALSLFSKLIETEDISWLDNYSNAVSVFHSALNYTDLVQEFRALPAKILGSCIEKKQYNAAKIFLEKIKEANTLEKEYVNIFSQLIQTAIESSPTVIIQSVDQRNRVVGHMTIFNQESFEKKKKFRYGSAADAIALERTFEKFGLQIEVEPSLKLDQIKQKIDNLSTADFSRLKLFMCVLMTHGGENNCVSAYDKYFDHKTEIIKPILKNRSLNGIPKIFIIVACRGPNSYYQQDDLDYEDILVSERDGISYSDFLICYSTYEGHKSKRDPKNGTDYIQELCKIIEEQTNSRMELHSIFARVNKILSKDKKKQVPVFESTMGEFFMHDLFLD